MVPVVRRHDLAKEKNVWVVLTKYSPGSDGCCEDKATEIVHFQPGVSRVEAVFENVEACPQPRYWCKYGLTWWGYTTMFGSLEPVLGEAETTQLPEILIEDGIELKGRVRIEDNRPFQTAYINFFHPALPSGKVQVEVAQDGSFSFIGLPAVGQVCWEFSSLFPNLMKVAGTLSDEAEMHIFVRTAQRVSGCLRRDGVPVPGASVQLYYEGWHPGPIEVGGTQAGSDGCFQMLRDRDVPADLKIYFGPTGRFRKALPHLPADRPAPPLDLGVIELGHR